MADAIALPPAPNWYGSALASWGGEDGDVYAYAAKNAVILLKPPSSSSADDDASAAVERGVFLAHDDDDRPPPPTEDVVLHRLLARIPRA